MTGLLVWLLLNGWWLIALAAVLVGLLSVIPATALVAKWLKDHAPRGTSQILAAAFAVSLASSWLVDYGASECRAEFKAAQAATQAEIERREREAFAAGAEAAQKAAQAQEQTRKETDEAVERVRVEWREKVVRVPAECRAAVALPDSVRDEGRKAVARARSALHD